MSRALALLPCLIIVASALGGCFTEPPLAPDVVVRCVDDSECPAGLRCSVDIASADGVATCRPPGCGDGVLDAGEVCDDGVDNSDVLADACRGDCTVASCGDGVLDTGERCELEDATCRPDCSRCGDGVVDAGEVCDDGVGNSDFAPGACRAACEPPVCGDGVKDPGEACDDGADNSDVLADACRSTCVKARCGDLVQDAGEQCDDGNNESGDGCVGDCNKVERCGDGIVDRGDVGVALETCDDANENPVDGCRGCQGQTFGREVVVGAPITDVSDTLTLVGHLAVAPESGCEGCTRLFVTAGFDHRVYRVDVKDAEIKSFVTIAGTGTPGDDGDGGPATLARLNAPQGVAFDARRNRIYIADSNNGLIRVIEPDGTIRTLAGRRGATLDDNDIEPQDAPDLRGAGALLFFPTGLELEGDGDLIVAEEGGFRVRHVDVTPADGDGDGLVSLVAGCPFAPTRGNCGELPGYVEGHCVPSVRRTCTIAGDCASDGTFACVDVDVGPVHDDGLVQRTCVLRSSGPPDCPANGVRTLSGVPVDFTFRDAPTRLATGVQIGPMNDPAVGPDGTIYWNDATTGRILAKRGDEIRTIAGSSRVNQGYSGDGGDARAARLSFPTSVLFRGGDLLVAEFGNHLIRRVDLTTGIIDTAAGAIPIPVTTGRCSPFDEFFADGFGGPCATARPGVDGGSLNGPRAIALAGDGGVLVAELGATQVRRINVDTTPGIITGPILGGPRVEPVALGPATSNDTLTSPGSIAFDPAGRLHFFEWNASVATGLGPGPTLQVGQLTTRALLLRENDDGTLERVGGGGSGGDGPALAARLSSPTDLAFVGDDDAIFVDGGALRRLRGGTISTVTLPAPITGIFSASLDAAGRVVAVDDTLLRVLRVGADGSVTVLADRSSDGGASFFYETMSSSSGVVHVLDLIDTSGGNFSTFDLDILRVADAGGLAPIAFDTSALATDLDINTFTVTGLIDEVVAGGVELTMVRHAAHELRRYRGDGTSVRVAGNGREPCRLGPVDDNGVAGPECDNTGDGLSSSAEVDPPTGNIINDDDPLRLNLRINVTFPGVDDLDPRTAPPRRAARQQVLQQASLARAPDGSLVLGEQPVTAVGVRPGVPGAPLLANAARLRRLADGRLRTIVGPFHPPGPGVVALDAALYNARALAVLPDGRVLAGGDDGRLMSVFDDGVTVVAGGGDLDTEIPVLTPARDLSLPGVITGLALHSNLLLVVGHEPVPATAPAVPAPGREPGNDDVACPAGVPGTGALVLLTLDDFSDPASWRLLHRRAGLDSVCGVAADEAQPGRFYVSLRDEHCVKSWSAEDDFGPAVAGTCGEAGRFGDFLDQPGGVVARGDVLFVGDVGNARIVRVSGEDPRTAAEIVGREALTRANFDVTPGQLAFDAWDNLYVASGTVVRQLTRVLDTNPVNVDIRTIYGQEPRALFPELSSFCLAGLATHTVDDTVVVSDACQRFLVRLLP